MIREEFFAGAVFVFSEQETTPFFFSQPHTPSKIQRDRPKEIIRCCIRQINLSQMNNSPPPILPEYSIKMSFFKSIPGSFYRNIFRNREGEIPDLLRKKVENPRNSAKPHSWAISWEALMSLRSVDFSATMPI